MSVIQTTQNGEWAIDESARDDDSYLSQYTSTTFEVIHMPSDTRVWTVGGSEHWGKDSHNRSGVVSVCFSDDERFAIATDIDGNTRQLELKCPVCALLPKS